MEYLNELFGLDVKHIDESLSPLPNYLSARYRFEVVSIEGCKAVFLYPKGEVSDVEALKKHLSHIEKEESKVAVLVYKDLPARKREYLIRTKIPFIAEGKQAYLPFIGTCLSKRGDKEKVDREELLPSSQLLFLLFIYKGCRDLYTSEAARILALTPTSISRASKELVDNGLLQIRKEGVQRILYSDKKPKELFTLSKDKLLNPVKKTVYISKESLDEDLPKSGLSALGELSLLNEPSVESYASGSIEKWKGVNSPHLYDQKKQVALEMWRYDPKKLTKSKTVDVLSLALSFNKNSDERIEEALDSLLDGLWREIDSKAN